MSTQELDLDAVAEELTARRFGSKPPVAEALSQEGPTQPPRDYLDDIADMLTKERLVGGEIGQDIGNYPQSPTPTAPPVPQPTVVEQPGMVGGDIGQVIGRDYSKLPEPIPQNVGGPSMMIGAGPSRQTMTGELAPPPVPPRPEPTIGPMTPAEQLRTQRTGITGELPPRPEGTTIGPPMTGVKEVGKVAKAKPEDYEYGEFAKAFDPLFQFTTEWVNARAFGLPKILTQLATGEKVPEPLTTTGKLAGAFGGLSGMTGWGGRLGIPKTGAPFEVAAKVAQRILRKPAETTAGKIVQSVSKSILTLAFGSAAVESEGENAKEILVNKLKAIPSGGVTGLVFGGAGMAKLSSSFPTLSWAMRAGMTSAVLDAINGQTPWDARPLMQKAYDYGLNIAFTRHAMSPKDMEMADKAKKEWDLFQKQLDQEEWWKEQEAVPRTTTEMPTMRAENVPVADVTPNAEGGWTFSFKFPKGVVPGAEKPVEQAPVKEPVIEPPAPGPTPEAKPGKAATPEPGTDAMQRLVEVAQEEVDAILARTSPGEGRDKAFADKRQAGKDLLEYLEAGDQLLFDDGTSLTITGIRRNKKTGEIELIDWLGDQKNAKGERKPGFYPPDVAVDWLTNRGSDKVTISKGTGSVGGKAKPEPTPVEVDAPLPNWLSDNVKTLAGPLEKSGVADKIEELAARRFTAKEIAKELGLDVDSVLSVRVKRGIPSQVIAVPGGGQTPNPEFETWLKSRTAKPTEATGPRKSPYQMTKQEYRDFMAKGKELTPEEIATIDANHEKYVASMRKSLNKGIVPPEVRAEYPKLFPKARKYGPKYSLEEMEQKGEERKRSMGEWEGMGGGVMPGKRTATARIPGRKTTKGRATTLEDWAGYYDEIGDAEHADQTRAEIARRAAGGKETPERLIKRRERPEPVDEPIEFGGVTASVRRESENADFGPAQASSDAKPMPLVKKERRRGGYGFNADQAWADSGKVKYKEVSTLGNIGIRGTWQNSIDAVLEAQRLGLIKDGRVDFDLDTRSDEFTVTDNGTGMTEDVLIDKFLSLFSTTKRDPTKPQSGGFGIEKAPILKPTEKADWDITTLDNYYNSALCRNGEFTQEATTPIKGTRLHVKGNCAYYEMFTDDAALYLLTAETPESIGVFINGHKIPNIISKLRGKDYDITPDSMVGEGTVTAKYIPQKEIDNLTIPGIPREEQAFPELSRRIVVRIADDKTGIKYPQFIDRAYSSKFEGAIIVDVRTNHVPGQVEYPLTDSRTALKYNVQNKIYEIVEKFSEEKLSAKRELIESKTKPLNSYGRWKLVVDKLMDDKPYQQLRDDIYKIYNASDGYGYGIDLKENPPYTPLDSMDVKVDENYEGIDGASIKNARLLTAVDAASRIMYGKYMGKGTPLRKFYLLMSKEEAGTVTRAEFAGGADELGINLNGIDKTALKSPYTMALWLREVILGHEYTHKVVKGHGGEEFTSEMAVTFSNTLDALPDMMRVFESYMGKPDPEIMLRRLTNKVRVAITGGGNFTTSEQLLDLRGKEQLGFDFEKEGDYGKTDIYETSGGGEPGEKWPGEQPDSLRAKAGPEQGRLFGGESRQPGEETGYKPRGEVQQPRPQGAPATEQGRLAIPEGEPRPPVAKEPESPALRGRYTESELERIFDKLGIRGDSVSPARQNLRNYVLDNYDPAKSTGDKPLERYVSHVYGAYMNPDGSMKPGGGRPKPPPTEENIQDFWGLKPKQTELTEGVARTERTAEDEAQALEVERRGGEGKVRQILEGISKDDIDKDIISRKFFDNETLESISQAKGISKQAVQQRLDRAWQRLREGPDGEFVKDYLKQKKYIELQCGIPYAKEIVDAVGRILARRKERRVVKLSEIKKEMESEGPAVETVHPEAQNGADRVAQLLAESEALRKKVIGAIKEAKPVRAEQEEIISHGKGKRMTEAENVRKETRGEAGFYAELSEFKGEYGKAGYEPIRGKFTQPEIDAMFNEVIDSPLVSSWETLAARKGLAKIFGEEGVRSPTENEIELLTRVFGRDFANAITDKAGRWEKIKRVALEAANVPRALMASMDFSAPLRQGLFLLPTYPKQWAGSFVDMFKYFGSEKALDALYKNVVKDPDYELAKKYKLAITRMGGEFKSREERWMGGGYAEHIPVPENIPVLRELAKAWNATIGKGVQASDRAYTGFLNKLRFDTFKSMVRQAEKAYPEQNVRKDDRLMRHLAGFINNATGRGGMMKSLENNSTALANIFFSPRLMASRLNLLNPGYYVKSDAFVRRKALISLFSFAAMGTTIMALAKQAGLDVGTDPDSADFGKIKIGNTRIDLWGGFQQYFVLAHRLASNTMVSSTTGRERTLGEGYKAPTRLSLISDFIERKENPVVNFAVDMIRGSKSYSGEKLNIPKEVAEMFIPMVIGDAVAIAKEDPKLLPLSVLGAFGVGVQPYKMDEYQKLLNQYFENKKGGITDEAGLKALKDYVNKQPAEKRKKLENRYFEKKAIYKLPDQGWWLGLAATQNPESRANMFWTRYLHSSEEDQKEMRKAAQRMPGVWTQRFADRYRELKKKNEQGFDQKD